MYIAAGADVEVDSSTEGVVRVVDSSMGGAVEVDSSAGDVGVDSPEGGVICVNSDILGV